MCIYNILYIYVFGDREKERQRERDTSFEIQNKSKQMSVYSMYCIGMLADAVRGIGFTWTKLHPSKAKRYREGHSILSVCLLCVPMHAVPSVCLFRVDAIINDMLRENVIEYIVLPAAYLLFLIADRQ